jgi:DNA-binding NtrC family response regulator
MDTESPLKNKTILVVDDEPDILQSIEDELDMCLIHTASDYDTAIQYLLSYTYDMVILDIMGVNGFEVLKTSVSRGFPTVMLTAHAMTMDALKKSIKLGAVTFLPKEKMADLRSFLEEIMEHGGQPRWLSLFDHMGAFFNKVFGPDWRERDSFFKEFEESVKRNEQGI